MTRPLALVALCLTTACGAPSEASWLRSVGARWVVANHRVSQIAWLPGDGVPEAAFIGGASTTGCVFVEGEGCVPRLPESDTCIDAGTCAEFVFLDRSEVAVDRVVGSASGRVVLGEAAGELVVGPAGSSTSLLVTLPSSTGSADAVAWIRGLALTTDVPKPSDSASCYDPRHGWLPRRLRVAVGTPTREAGRSWLVPVEATFEGGFSDESVRACLDAVVGEEALALRVEIAMAAGTAGRTTAVRQEAAWERGATQRLADLGDRAADVGEASGWRTLDWRFHQTVEPGRGAYVRSLAAWIDPDAGEAFGVGTNFSPTQLSGVDVVFEGEVVTLDDVRVIDGGLWGAEGLETPLTPSGAAVLVPLDPLDAPFAWTEDE